MKTSATQFETLVAFMEKHGDLNKPTQVPRSKIDTIKKWEILRHKLNRDSTGDSKGTEKWKKVWSDLKNNTKKKASRIQRAVAGGPPVQAPLHDLEKRVLQILAKPQATGYTSEIESELSHVWRKGLEHSRSDALSCDLSLSNDSTGDAKPGESEEQAVGSAVSGPVTVYFMEDVDTTEITLQPNPGQDVPGQLLEPRVSIMEPKADPRPVRPQGYRPPAYSPPSSPNPAPSPRASTPRKKNSTKKPKKAGANLMKIFLNKKLKMEQQKLDIERQRNKIFAQVGAEKVAAINRLTDVLQGISDKILSAGTYLNDDYLNSVLIQAGS
ncbi:uncharacterized protein LOC142973448 [Anticarsia gemmatalis]|uniref:uncharacterized protein LOC142973448 n=1 Tax=Anticarsia gemmatalis TaxID=129554 RepID=UPI003F776848